MKTLLLGYAQADGRGPATLVAGPDAPNGDKVGYIMSAKGGGKFPQGVARLSLVQVNETMAAIAPQTITKPVVKPVAESEPTPAAEDKIEPKKKTMKHHATHSILLAAALCLAASSLSAQTYAPQSLSVPTAITLGATSNLNTVLDVRKQASVGVLFSFQGASGTTNGVQTVSYTKSVDGNTYTTTAETIALTPNTNIVVNVLTNLSTQGAGYIKLTTWANGDSAANGYMTNITVKYGIKIP